MHALANELQLGSTQVLRRWKLHVNRSIALWRLIYLLFFLQLKVVPVKWLAADLDQLWRLDRSLVAFRAWGRLPMEQLKPECAKHYLFIDAVKPSRFELRAPRKIDIALDRGSV